VDDGDDDDDAADDDDGDDGHDDNAPSELLGPLLEEWPDLLGLVLTWLDPTDCALLARVAKAWLAVVLANNLPRAGKAGAVPLKVTDFVGSVEMLAWAKDNGCPWESRTCAAAGGRLDVLQWARKYHCPWDERTTVFAARGGHLEVLKWAREHSCPFTRVRGVLRPASCGWSCAARVERVLHVCHAAGVGQGERVSVGLVDLRTRSSGRAPGGADMGAGAGCQWGERTCRYAAEGGHLEVLRWARAHGCLWEELRMLVRAAEGGHLAVLKWLQELGALQDCPWDHTGNIADCRGHLDVLKWARAHGCPFERWTSNRAAGGGHLDVLMWLREVSCRWDALTCRAAAQGGHLKVLQWAREQDCPWDASTCHAAAEHGHLEVLQWARAHGCEWDEATIHALAAEHGHQEVVTWLEETDE